MSGYPGIRAEAATQICESDSLEKKIILATEGFMTKFSEYTLRDKLSKESALVVADYIIAMKRDFILTLGSSDINILRTHPSVLRKFEDEFQSKVWFVEGQTLRKLLQMEEAKQLASHRRVLLTKP